MAKHYAKSPSAANRWMTCTGSLTLPAEEDSGSSYAQEGTEAHSRAEQRLVRVLNHLPPPSDECAYDPYVMHYVNFIEGVVEAYPPDKGGLGVEETLVSKSVEGLGGTPDFFMVSGNQGFVVDYKHGAGTYVEVEENRQLLLYAFMLSELRPAVEEWTLVVVQPRVSGPPVRSWKCSTERVTQEGKAAVEATEGPPVFCHGDHCRWCPAILHCDHLKQQTLAVAQQTFEEVPDGEKQEWCGKVMKLAPAVASLAKAAKEYALGVITKGGEFAGYKAVDSFGNRQWAYPDEEIIKKLCNKGFGVKKTTVKKLMSPTQFCKAHGDKAPGLIHRPHKGVVLAPEDDRREAVVFTSPDAAFGIVET